MARCEDFPCCGHESGCCPDYDEGHNQLNMVCTCGAKLSPNNRYSICDTCLSCPDPDDYDPGWDGPDDFYPQDNPKIPNDKDPNDYDYDDD